MTTNQLTPTLRTVAGLFDGEDAIYTVPVYQRNFAWRAPEIEQLISDIQDAVTDGQEAYFLGNLIVTQRRSPVTDFEVIDGQQRLTTLYLLLTYLAGEDAGRFGQYRGRLRYESRPKATEALRRATATSPAASAALASAMNEDSGIHEGFNVIGQFIRQHPQLRHRRHRRAFADFLWSNVTLVRASLPGQIDLNRYFEIMNTRGQQLQQVDIVKARLMSQLPTEAERACFAWIWDACADMDSYVQMTLTNGRPRRRGQIFGDRWSWLDIGSFEGLLHVHQTGWSESEAGATLSTSLSLEDALGKYAAARASAVAEDQDNVRFRSTIGFPAFLLHVLKVVNRDDAELEGQLDDKQLITRFDQAVDRVGSGGEAQWVRDFAADLLKLRNLFDGFILKRQDTGNNVDDSDWSLQRLLMRKSKNRPIPGYINTFSRSRAEVEEDGDVDPSTRDVLLLQSMLRVTYTSPRTMHWITKLLRFLSERDPAGVHGSELVGLLREYSREKVREAFFVDEQPIGFTISRIVFTYLDYLLLTDQQKAEFRFSFRNSIEHFYPQSPDEQQSGATVSKHWLDRLGNLALVSVSANSRFSNSLPRAKAENYRTTIERQSPKLQAMAAITRADGWSDLQVRQHHDEVVKRLKDDVGIAV